MSQWRDQPSLVNYDISDSERLGSRIGLADATSREFAKTILYDSIEAIEFVDRQAGSLSEALVANFLQSIEVEFSWYQFLKWNARFAKRKKIAYS